MTASNSKSVKVHFFNLKGQPLNVSDEADNLAVAVSHQGLNSIHLENVMKIVMKYYVQIYHVLNCW